MMALITSDCDAMRIHARQMALITSDCDAMRIHDHQMALITSDCDALAAAARRPGRLAGQLLAEGGAAAGGRRHLSGH